jgi:hypothetical protein
MADRATLIGMGSITAIINGTRVGVGDLGSMALESADDYLAKAGNLAGLADVAAARTALGLGTLATQSGTFSGTSSGTNTGDQTITLTGHVTGSGTGTFGTTIAAGVVTNAMLAGSIDLGTKVTGTLPLANGGTAAALTASNGGVVYSGASALAVLGGTPTAGKILRSGGSGAPTWSTPTAPNTAATGAFQRGDGTNWVQSTLTLPDTLTANQVLYGSGTDAAGGSANLVISGASIGVGGVSGPSATVHIAAGSTAAGSAPIKFTSGPLMTTPEAMAVEALTDNLHFTITTGAARKGVVLDNGARLTSGTFPLGTTNGRLIDSIVVQASSKIGISVNPGVKLEVYDSTLTGTTTFANIVARVGSSASGADCTLGFTDNVAFNSYISAKGGTFSFGPGGTTAQFTVASSGVATFPNVGTTASAANAFLDNGASNSLLRSTSSLAFKRLLGPLPLDEARNVVLNSEPIRYQSRSGHDNPLTEHIGFAAEQVAQIDGRFISRRRDGSPDWVQYSQFVAPLCLVVADLDSRLARLERLH